MANSKKDKNKHTVRNVAVGGGGIQEVTHLLDNPTYLLDDTTIPYHVEPEVNKGYTTWDGKGRHNSGAFTTANADRFKMDSKLTTVIDNVNKSVYLPAHGDSVSNAFAQTVAYYNRFKIPNPDLYGHKYVPYIFFVRPSLNIYKGKGNKTNVLQDSLAISNNQLFTYANKFSPELLKELDAHLCNQNTDFMYSLSNAAVSFSTSDEYIDSDTYGKNYGGYEIAYGKGDTKSKASDEITFEFKETHDFHIYLLHRLWVEYISGCYRGEIVPKTSSIYNRILDYAGAVYYIVTAEDGETILFWTKYYGIFPTEIPSNQFSWGEGNLIGPDNTSKISIKYKYSFKSDYDPYILYREFNLNAHVGGENATKLPTDYEEIYNKDNCQVGKTWMTVPYITIEKTPHYCFKLHFISKAVDNSLVYTDYTDYAFTGLAGSEIPQSSSKKSKGKKNKGKNSKGGNSKTITPKNTGGKANSNKPRSNKSKKSNTAIAKEVIQGKWSVGATRKKRLTAAGYDYDKVQAEVNRLLKK